ncbi:MAG: CAP domain-containing protein, partial [Actinobacteria bacterium]|nr:CAP domain-containing protein [Actinomycetota bacterium]
MLLRSHSPRVLVRIASYATVLALAGTLALFAGPAVVLETAHAATWTVDTTIRTEADVRAVWAALEPAYTGTPYAVVPSVSAPYSPGDAAAGFRGDAVNTVNFARYLAGLPYDVTLNATRNADAQYGAVLLKASTFSHTPPKPADMDQAFYDRGYASTSSSNIGYGYGTSHAFQRGCVDDSDSGNIDRVGHRRWLLNPRMLYTGIGYAESFHTTYAFDTSRPSADVAYDYVAWPSAGYFPIEFASRYTPWSITLNPARYDWDATRTGHAVTLRRVSDGRTWVIDEADTNTGGEYFNANFNGYGVANCFIFRPNPADLPSGYAAGEQYDVTLSGGIYAEGTRNPVTVSFRTTFMTLAAPTPT